MTTATSDWAASYAEELLSPLGDRWLHVQGVAFFGCLYFAALRPEEAISLAKHNLSLPRRG